MKRQIALLLLAALLLAGCGNASSVASAEDLPGQRIGAVAGSTGAAYARGYTAQGSVVTLYDSPEMLAAAIESGAVDCGVADTAEASAVVKFARRLKTLKEPLAQDGFRIAAALESVDLLAVIDDAMASLSEEGVLHGAVNHYLSGWLFHWGFDGEGTFAHTLTVAVDTNMAPYAYYDEDGVLTGLDVDVARAVACRAGFNVTFVHVDQERLLDTVRKGNADFALGALVKTEETALLVAFSDPYVSVTEQILVRKR